MLWRLDLTCGRLSEEVGHELLCEILGVICGTGLVGLEHVLPVTGSWSSRRRCLALSLLRLLRLRVQ